MMKIEWKIGSGRYRQQGKQSYVFKQTSVRSAAMLTEMFKINLFVIRNFVFNAKSHCRRRFYIGKMYYMQHISYFSKNIR